MALPRLPVQTWAHISTFLDSESLSSLSQVSTTSHMICTDEYHFRRMIPTEEGYYTHPMQLFRRCCALYYPPSYCISITGTAQYDILRTVQDNLLVVNQGTMQALALPSGVTFNIYELLNEPNIFPGPYPHVTHYLQTVSTALPGSHIAFVHRRQPSRLVVQNLLVNRTLIWEIQRDESVVARRIVGDSSIAPAGNNAECLIFYSSESCFTLFDWRRGSRVGTCTIPSPEAKLMMGECPTIDEMSVVGVFTEKRVGSLKEINCFAFEHEDSIPVDGLFYIPHNKIPEVVLRSRDMRTYVLIFGTVGKESCSLKEFKAYRVESGVKKTWKGRLSLAAEFHYPKLCENGRVIAAKEGMTYLQSVAVSTSPQQKLWIELLETGLRTTMIPPLNAELWEDLRVIWTRRAYDGGYALIARTSRWRRAMKIVVDLVKIVRDGRSKMMILKRWFSSTLTDWCVVADHFVIAKRFLGGTVCVYHFDEFCGRAIGVCHCPGIIPPGFRWTAKESHMNRKRGMDVANANPEV